MRGAPTLEDQPEAARSGAISRAPVPWRLRFAGPFTPPRLAPLWLRRSRWLLAALTLSMLVAATLLGAVPIYSELVSDVQLQNLLASRPPADINVEGIVKTGLLTPDNAQQIDAIALGIGHTYLGAFSSGIYTYIDSDPVIFTHINQIVVGSGRDSIYHDLARSDGRPYSFDFAQAAPHMNIIAGRLPREVPAGQMPEVLATPKLGVYVGDTVGVALFGGPGTEATARVVGIWFPKDQNDPFWNNHSYDTVDIYSDNSPTRPVYPLVFARGGLFSMIASITPRSTSSNQPFGGPSFVRYFVYLHYLSFTGPSLLTAPDVPDVIGKLAEYRNHIATGFPAAVTVSSVAVISRLDTFLEGLQQQLSLLDLPLYVVVAQIAALALFCVMALAGLLVETQGDAIAALKSRGASRFQLVGAFGVLAVLPAALAAAGGVFVAARLAVWLVTTFVPAAAHLDVRYLSSAARPELALTPVMAACAAGVLTVAVAAYQALRRDVLTWRREQARGGRAPLWKRYYLDLFLALLCIAGYLELGSFGGLDIRAQLGVADANGADPLLIVSPVLLLLASALLVLRLLPLVAGLGARLAARSRGATGMLAFADLARTSGQFTRLALLLALSVGMSLFALNFVTSLDRSAADRAAYATGSDQRLVANANILITGFTGDLGQQITTAPGVEAAAPIARPGFKTTQSQGGMTVGGLAIDPAQFAQAVYWRSDFAAQSLSALLDQMRQHTAGVSAGEPDHPVWALVSTGLAGALQLSPGERFSLDSQDGRRGNMSFVVGAIIDDFPTMYNSFQAGYLVVDQADLFAAIANPDIGNLPLGGPTEYWLRTTGTPADDAARAAAFEKLGLPQLIAGITDRRALVVQYRGDPVTAGMSGLLLVGTIAAALLAVLACLAQAVATARARLTQFAVLRSLGMSTRQLRAILLGQQFVIYLFGLASGILLGLLLTSATLPYLAFSSTLVDRTTLGVPPYLIVFNLAGIAIYVGLLLLVFAAAVALQARVAARIGLGRTLRIGED
jgi:hypothetical protein